MIALVFLDIHAKYVNDAVTLLQNKLMGVCDPVSPIFITETFGSYEILILLKYNRYKDLNEFLERSIRPIVGLQRVEKYSVQDPVWLASNEAILANPPENKIHAVSIIETEPEQQNAVYKTLREKTSDFDVLKKFLGRILYQDKLQIVLGLQCATLETLDNYLKKDIRVLPGVANTNTLLGTLFTYICPPII